MGSSDPNFLTAFGGELCEALSPTVPDDQIVPGDGYEVWRRAFGSNPAPEALAALAAPQWERLRDACADYFECPGISESQVRLAVSRTLARWPR